ncbi:sensor histidine kinase [Cellulomonas sp. S1-8]|uniref:sensor histidine kinase n=1 Tax=Cellulomonas sp. S1-8 TaxID=2904790 RepID=UPI002242F198|nr:sensor histidine kinase [Cellulomonas sp. S1-8]UZN03585.1 sensor histidine kinase [Cellulomonas sp. S1-8]
MGGDPDDAPGARRSRSGADTGAGAGAVAVAAVGVAQLALDVLAPDPLGTGGVVWWVAYLVVVATFALDVGPVRRRPPSSVLVAVGAVATSVAWLAHPAAEWTPVLFVVTAVSATDAYRPAGVTRLIAAQTVVIAVGGLLGGRELLGAAFTTAVYGAFQFFATAVVRAADREARARADADAAHASLAAAHAELAAAHADLRATSALLGASTRDAERLRIARDLHDVVGHQLTALALELEIATHTAGDEARTHVVRARGVAKDLLQDVRAVVGELRTAPSGLTEALRDVLDVPGLDVALDVEPGLPLAEAHRVVVVRCVQEAATNTLRHAGATHLDVRVARSDDGAATVVEVRDDGGGATAWTPGHGLRGMRERIEALGGTLDVDPGPGRGFGLVARVPT